MQISLQLGSVLAFLIATAHALGFVVIAAPFALATVPRTAQLALAVGMGMAGAAIHTALPATTPALIGQLAWAAATGALIGFVALAAISIGSQAGSFIGLLGGFVTPPSLTPLAFGEVPVTGDLYGMIWAVLFFVSGADVVVLRGFYLASDASVHLANTATVIVQSVTLTFAAGLEVAAPVIAVMFFAQIVAAVLTKVAPQLQPLGFLFPLEILLSLIMMVVSLPVIPHLFDAGVRLLLAAERDLGA
ncbi:putative flagellar biosynthesis pathway protein [Acidimicrobium ferrooxidans DSM 10331]|uniref:Putative flagellar biosynthesis pathway protein n=1 Tax=Acidimicrobium ferrooxidans (strain DSM 10331 / JCM 15462 / NBRC 103882 / ICP) TaxID=525909 RepID=C7M228_ACIFD|nr:flagellar biosynthetic protein FliR [Acidimicrobium ferrooxidans]ACU53126.1 putative flagellar biosynthesis pathway protein [Acidimicrobium ferrooxidans DSM 10331]